MSECFIIAYWQIATIGLIIAIPCVVYCALHKDDTKGLGKFTIIATIGFAGIGAFLISMAHYLPCITVVP